MPILEAIAEAKRAGEKVVEIDYDRMSPALWYTLEFAGYVLDYIITGEGPVIVCSWE